MTSSIDGRVGRSLMAVRVVVERDVELHPLAAVSVDIVWDDRLVHRLKARQGLIVVDEGRWTTDATTRSDGDAAQDVSRMSPYAALVGRELTAVSTVDGSTRLELDGALLSVDPSGDTLVVTVTAASHRRQWWHVRWRQDDPDTPVDLYHEIVDSLERRKVEVWRDGRQGAASAFVELGGSQHSTEPFPSLEDVSVDPQFDASAVSGDVFEAAWRAALDGVETRTLWRPTGPTELRLVEESGWRRWPPRLPDQPIFYPVTSREDAERIAREWNVPDSGAGFVTRFEVVRAFMDRYQRHEAGGSALTEWWVPAAELEDLNDHVVGTIEVVEKVGR